MSLELVKFGNHRDMGVPLFKFVLSTQGGKEAGEDLAVDQVDFSLDDGGHSILMLRKVNHQATLFLFNKIS